MPDTLPFMASVASAGHAGEMDSPAVMPHELLAGLVGLAGLLLVTIAVLVWVVWRLRRLDRRLRVLEGGRKGKGVPHP
jgi:hypothetical protein